MCLNLSGFMNKLGFGLSLTNGKDMTKLIGEPLFLGDGKN